jgi:hypothetical protein
MTVFEYIKNCVNVKLAPSKIHGVGVFALRDIEVKENLFVEWKRDSGPYFLNQTDFFKLEENVINHLYDMFEFQKHDGVWKMEILLEKDCHWIFKTPLHWVNSCSWNDVPNFDKETMLATRKIKKGEELLTQYGKYEKFVKHNLI